MTTYLNCNPRTGQCYPVDAWPETPAATEPVRVMPERRPARPGVCPVCGEGTQWEYMTWAMCGGVYPRLAPLWWWCHEQCHPQLARAWDEMVKENARGLY